MIRKTILLLLVQIITSYASAFSADSIKIQMGGIGTFRGERIHLSSDTTNSFILKGTFHSNNFNVLSGYFSHIKGANGFTVPIYISITNPSSDTIFLNLISGSLFQREKFSKDLYIYDDLVYGKPASKYVFMKEYNYGKDKWYIYNADTLGTYKNGNKYDTRENKLYDLSDNYWEDFCMSYLMYLIMIYISLYIIISPYTSKIKNVKKQKCLFYFSAFIPIPIIIGVDSYVFPNLALPFFILLFYFIVQNAYSKHQKAFSLLHLPICVSIIVLFGYLQFFNNDENLCLDDNTNLKLHWRSGTGLLKRHIIRSMLHDLTPVYVTDHEKTYRVFVSKYEFSHALYSIVNEEILGTLDYILQRKEPVTDLSYREAQIVMQRLQDDCGLKFDLLSYPEWKSAALSMPHMPRPTNYADTDKGIPNPNGLVHVTDNAAEYTSSYVPRFRATYDVSSLKKNFNSIVVAGYPFMSDKAIDFCVVDKNIRKGDVGFRIIYRPNDIGARHFQITGILQKTLKDSNYPRSVKLNSYNGVDIKSIRNFECFEELVVEQHHCSKSIKVQDLNDLQIKSILLPSGFDAYEWSPHFSFGGME